MANIDPSYSSLDDDKLLTASRLIVMRFKIHAYVDQFARLLSKLDIHMKAFIGNL